MKKIMTLPAESVVPTVPRHGITAGYAERWVVRETMPARQANELQWHALCVRPRFEKVVAEHIRYMGYDEYLPMYRIRRHWSDRVKQIEKVLFPGYIFCKFDAANRMPILMIAGVVSVVSFGGQAAVVPEDEILAVQSVVVSGLPYEPCSFLNAGHPIRIERGPLRGLEGLVVETKNNWRFVVSVHMLQRSVSVEVDKYWVNPVQPGNCR